MRLFDKLTSKNFQAFAMESYYDPLCEDIEDFQEDLRRFLYLKILLYRHHEYGEVRERLMLNHLITLFNVFGYEPCMKMLEFKIKEDAYWSSIKTMLIYLELVEDDFKNEVPLDTKLIERLRDL